MRRRIPEPHFRQAPPEARSNDGGGNPRDLVSKQCSSKRALLLLAASLLASIGGCGWLPHSGPSSATILSGDVTSKGYHLVEIDRDVLAALDQYAPPSFSGGFPEYSPPGAQVIGIGDSVLSTIWEAGPGGLFSAPAVGSFSTGSRSATIPEQVVARDGAISIPYAGRISVVGHTPPQVQQIIVDRLAGVAVKAQALVTITRNASNIATVISEVGPGARVPLTLAGDRLLDVIAVAGGVHAPTQDLVVSLTRDGRTISVPMQVLLKQSRENVFVQPHDVITLVRQPQTFLMFGAVPRTGQITFDAVGISLAEALAKAGGLLTDRADLEGVFVLRREPADVLRAVAPAGAAGIGQSAVPVIYRLNMRDPLAMLEARQMAIRDKDILYVSEARLVDVQKVLGMFQLLTTPILTGAAVKSAAP